MKSSEISFARVVNQHISKSFLKTSKEVVEWMGAIQAQDYNMAKWAVGLRLNNSTDKLIEVSYSNGEILRTHILRPTWHFVSASDISWMLELTAPHIKNSAKSRHKELELSDTVFKKCYKIITKSLQGGEHLTREELGIQFEKAKIAINSSRLIHIMFMAELDQVVTSGKMKDKKHTYALFSDRVSNKKFLTTEEALAELASRYFRSHGPATLQDFLWWSGLPMSKAKQAMELVKSQFHSEIIDTKIYYFDTSSTNKKIKKGSCFFLPAYDEYIISYKDRSASLAIEHQNFTISSNGIFNPAIIVDGQVIGIWKRKIIKNTALVEPHYFKNPGKETKQLILEAIKHYGKFLNKEIEFKD
jgi:hypothetical protein